MLDGDKAGRHTYDRRTFLAQLASGSLVAAAATAKFPGNILAADDPPRALPPHYVSGVLTEIASDHVRILPPGSGYEAVLVRLLPSTQVCKGSCELDWTALRMLDRAEVGTHDGPDGVRIAEWLNANAIYSWNTVAAIDSESVTLAHVEEMPYMSGPPRRLLIGPYTEVHAHGQVATGRAHILRTGDMLYFTGCAKVPEYDAGEVMAIVIVQCDMATGGGGGGWGA